MKQNVIWFVVGTLCGIGLSLGVGYESISAIAPDGSDASVDRKVAHIEGVRWLTKSPVDENIAARTYGRDYDDVCHELLEGHESAGQTETLSIDSNTLPPTASVPLKKFIAVKTAASTTSGEKATLLIFGFDEWDRCLTYLKLPLAHELNAN